MNKDLQIAKETVKAEVKALKKLLSSFLPQNSATKSFKP